LPYCRKCGTKLDDAARFCHVCGTAVTPLPATTPRAAKQPPRRIHLLPLAAAILIAVLVIAVVGVAIAFVPLQPVNFNQSNEASAANIDSLKLIVDAEVANVNVTLKNLQGNQRATINVSATGRRGIFGSEEPLALAFKENTTNSTLAYSVNVSRAEGWPFYNPLDVECNVYLDPSVNLDITIRTQTGSIIMNTNNRDVTLEKLSLQTTTGNVQASLEKGVVIVGDISLQTTTGSMQLIWDEAEISRNINVNVMTTTGSTELNVTQSQQLEGNVTLNAQTTTGGVNFALTIRNEVGARISAATTVGGVNIQQKGFSGNQTLLESDNYPAASNFIVNLATTLGGVDINALYGFGGVRS
jgi:hypothetical protein